MSTSLDKPKMIALALGKGGVRRSLPAAGLAILLLATVAYVLPGGERNPLWETTAWSIVVLASFVGWGSLVHEVVARRERVDLGLRAVWGASLLCFLAGALMVPSMMKRVTALGLIETGMLLALVSLVRERSAVYARARFVSRMIKREPRLALVAAIVAFVVAIQFFSGIADWHRNPYDDDIAYLAFVKKLNDTGTVIEPFSFRRLSALGGQTFFLQLVSIRAGVNQCNTFDRSICVVLIALLIAGYRAHGRRASLVFVLLTIMFVVTLPCAAINTASYYSGVVFFLALFRTLAWLGDRPNTDPWKAAVPIALVSAATCTLRQNYLPVPVFVLATSYGFHALTSKERWSKRLIEPALTLVFTLVAITPWLVASWQSSRTFVYPLMHGTFNQALALNASGMSFIRELWYQVWTALEGIGVKTFGLFVLGAALLRERGRRPVWSFAIGAAAGFAMLVHGFTQSDAANIGRYAFAFLMVFVLTVSLAAGTTRLEARPGRAHMMIGIVLVAVLGQLVASREELYKSYTTAFHNIEELHFAAPRSDATAPFEAGLYYRLQASVPEGERIAILLDDPHNLDFKRNPIWNLDMPGYASLPPGMPFFKGSAELKAYFQTLQVRYVAFVMPEYSRYHYRREYWIEMLTNEQEIWRAFSPYLLNFLDMLTDLADKHHALFDERGLIVIDLEDTEP